MTTETTAGVQFDLESDRAWPEWMRQRVLPAAADVDARMQLQRGQTWGVAVSEILRRRDDAINYRQQEQIEWTWASAEQTYGQQDDGVQGQQGWRSKETLVQGGTVPEQQENGQTHSDAFVRMAARYYSMPGPPRPASM